jgi:glutamate synthase (NADPH/NADH) large chain
MLQKHYEYTGSTIAKFILEDLNNQLQYFVKVFPKDYKKALAKARKVKGEIEELTPALQGGDEPAPAEKVN